MEGLKLALIWIIIFAAIAAGGYWAFTTIETGSEFAEKSAVLMANEARMKEEAAQSPAELENEAAEETEAEPPEAKEINPEAETIKTDLEDLLAQKIILKPGDSGVFVLRIQKFLNYYDKNLNMGEDQDFGPTTKKAVESFQKDQDLSPDGEIGPQTISKMIDSFSQ